MSINDQDLRVITIWKGSYSTPTQSASVVVPRVEGPYNLRNVLYDINADVVNYVNEEIRMFNENMQEYPDSNMSLNISYDVLTNDQRWFTLRIATLNTAADSETRYKFYNIDRESGRLVNLADIFAGGIDYVQILSDNIKEQMRWIMRNREGAVYFIKDRENPDGFDRIKEDQNFYINSRGELVIVFDQGEVAPSYMGTPEFIIPYNVFHL